jgi:hypothetical protein
MIDGCKTSTMPYCCCCCCGVLQVVVTHNPVVLRESSMHFGQYGLQVAQLEDAGSLALQAMDWAHQKVRGTQISNRICGMTGRYFGAFGALRNHSLGSPQGT